MNILALAVAEGVLALAIAVGVLALAIAVGVATAMGAVVAGAGAGAVSIVNVAVGGIDVRASALGAIGMGAVDVGTVDICAKAVAILEAFVRNQYFMLAQAEVFCVYLPKNDHSYFLQCDMMGATFNIGSGTRVVVNKSSLGIEGHLSGTKKPANINSTPSMNSTIRSYFFNTADSMSNTKLTRKEHYLLR